MMRIGVGYDIHRLVLERKLFIGGIEIPYIKGLLGHSDADVLLHAITDALLGAAALGDIGSHFSDKDPQWKGVDSLLLLTKSVEILKNAGYVPVNIDASVHLETPKLGPLKAEMAAKIAQALHLDPKWVSIKAKTGEGVDGVGRGEIVEAVAIAQVTSIQ